MLEAHGLHGLRHAQRFSMVNGRWFSCSHGTVMTPARANIAEDQKGRRAVVPAFPDVGTSGLFADGMETQALHDLPDVPIVRSLLEADFKPGRQALARRASTARSKVFN